jgi:hypothetical protein
MDTLLHWTLQTIRQDPSDYNWMEERRLDWVPLVQRALERMVDGEAVLLLCDPKRRWLEHYILDHINDAERKRPFFPVQSLRGIFPNIDALDSRTRVSLLGDMLDIAYPQGYFIWYIGDGNHPYTKIAYHREGNFLWLIDAEISGSFAFHKTDPLLDIKLLQLYKLFDKSLQSILFGQVALK